MPRYSKPLACPRALEFVGEHDLDLVAVMQRGASIGHDGFADVEAFKNFGGGSEVRPTRTLRVSMALPFTTCRVRRSMAVRGTATPQERLAAILARANMPTLSDGLLFREILTLPSWVA